MPRSSGTWTKEKPPANTFKPGQSGNPSGRPPVVLVDGARDLTKVALDRLKFLVDHAKDQRVQLDAAAEILNRGWGRPAQALSIDAHLTTQVGGVDRPALVIESYAQWLDRARTDLTQLEHPPPKEIEH